MKKILSIVIVYIIIGFTADCSAMDTGRCLTCHQFEGLVTQQRPGDFKIIHIDEEKYIKSPHGKVDCRKCHLAVTEIPHTGKTEVNCNTGCHSENELIGAMDSYNTGSDCVSGCHTVETSNVKNMERYLRSIHKEEQSAIIKLRSESSCRVCHSLYPHSKHNLVRAIINMHAGFITCEVCHLRSNTRGRFKICSNCHTAGRNLIYGWMNREDVEFKGDPYGRYYKNEKKKDNIISSIIGVGRDLFNKYVFQGVRFSSDEPTDYSVSRIAVFTEKNGEKVPVLSKRDTKAAITYKSREKRLSARSKKRRLKYFHRNVAMLSISVACDECHYSDSLLTYEELGFDESRIKKLRNLNIKGIITHYDVFYFPKLLDIKEQ